MIEDLNESARECIFSSNNYNFTNYKSKADRYFRNIISWLWNFGDGSTSFSSAPVHTYAQGGSYEVSLTVTNIYDMESEPHIEMVQLQSSMPGDVNFDSVLNILDVVIVVNYVLGNDTPTSSEFAAADLNGDGILNILDIVTLTNLILEV